MALKDVVMVNRLLIHGNNSTKATPPSIVNEKRQFIDRFWTVVQSISGVGYENQRSKTVGGQPVVIKALAKLPLTTRTAYRGCAMRMGCAFLTM